MLGDCGLNTPATCSPQDFSVRHTVTPGDPQDALQTADVELLQGLDMTAVGYPGLTAVEEGGNADCLIHSYFCMQMEVLVRRLSLPKAADAC